MDPIRGLLHELERDPSRFRATDGYDRLLRRLWEGDSPAAIKEALCGDAEFVGDLLATVADLESVDSFVFEAARHLASEDKGTAAYAMEIVLRGTLDPKLLGTVFERLSTCDVAVCEHAVRILAAQGLSRVGKVLEAAGLTWSAAYAETFLHNLPQRELIEELASHTARDRQIVGAVLATLASERDPKFAEYLERSDHAWVRDYGQWLRETLH